MRAAALSLIGCCFLLAEPCCNAASAGDQFPYEARIVLPEVEVRCGPGWDYYATGVLHQGDKVKIYRQEPGGWLAIRPPKNSFGWVAARHLQLTADPAIGKISVESAVAWVGSSIRSGGQLKWQVRLDQGERVSVLGKEALSAGPGFAIETYYRIAPPAGEFRWIHMQYANSPKTAGHHVTSSTIQLIGFRPTGRKKPTAPVAGTGRLEPVATDVSTPTSGATKDLEARVGRLRVDLGLLVSQPIEQWELNALRQRANTLTENAAGTQWEPDVRNLATRITEFEKLKHRYLLMLEGPEDRNRLDGVSPVPQSSDDDAARQHSDSIDTNISPVSAITTNGIESNSDNDFIAEGWLVPVHSTKRIAPPFALLDDEGRVRSYVSPMPGLNLRLYQRKYVGLYGQRRYMRSLRAPHVTAERAVKQKHKLRTTH